MDYQEIWFVSVDLPLVYENMQDGESILKWLDQTLESNPNRWEEVFTHFRFTLVRKEKIMKMSGSDSSNF